MLASYEFDEFVEVHCGDATEFCHELSAAGTRFGFVFIDHSHAYQHVEVCEMLADITLPGGFCLFHDYNDPRNRNPSKLIMGVSGGA